MRRYHSCNISAHNFKDGDFIPRKIQTTKDRHMLFMVFEGPFELVEVTWPISYRLQWEHDSEVPNSWNIDQLRLFYM
jgi:hypothetical protein